MQHPTQRFLRSDMLASLRRWTGGSIPDTEIPIDATIASMDAANVDLGLLSTWRGPNGQDLISNDEVAEWIQSHPDRFAGLATVDLDRPMVAVRELRRRVKDGFVGLRHVVGRRGVSQRTRTDRGVGFYPAIAHCSPERDFGERRRGRLATPAGAPRTRRNDRTVRRSRQHSDR